MQLYIITVQHPRASQPAEWFFSDLNEFKEAQYRLTADKIPFLAREEDTNTANQLSSWLDDDAVEA